MRVLTVAQFLLAHERDGLHGRVGTFAHLAAQAVADRGVVTGRGVEGAQSQLAASLQSHVAFSLDLFKNGGVIGRIGHDGDVAVVLGRGANQGDAADVDVLDQRVKVGAGAGRLLERIEVDDDHVDAGDAVILHVLHVALKVAAGEDAAEDERVQRLDAAAKNVGELGDVRNLDHGHARVAEHLRRAGAGKDLPAEFDEAFAEFESAGLVGDGNKCAFHGLRLL